jgi:hypothetical protein
MRSLSSHASAAWPRAVDQPGKARQQLAAIAELGQHDLAAFDRQRAGAVAVIVGDALERPMSAKTLLATTGACLRAAAAVLALGAFITSPSDQMFSKVLWRRVV